jgi:hypothetical protein
VNNNNKKKMKMKMKMNKHTLYLQIAVWSQLLFVFTIWTDLVAASNVARYYHTQSNLEQRPSRRGAGNKKSDVSSKPHGNREYDDSSGSENITKRNKSTSKKKGKSTSR